MKQIPYYIPFAYFVKTRLNTKSAILFHGYSEYLLGILILIYAGLNPLDAVLNFLMSYLAFICIYEIGYIINDCVSIRYEQNPRKRVKELNPPNLLIIFWIVIRIASFILITFLLQQVDTWQWWIFYLILVLVFFVHNILRIKQYRVFTFMCLAFLRFYAPLFPFASMAFLANTLNAILIFYVFFRTITYLDSKGLLAIPGRATFNYKTAYYFFLLPYSATVAILVSNYLTLWINIYFLIFWSFFYLVENMGFISKKNFREDE